MGSLVRTLLVSGALSVAFTGQAQGATTIGQTFTPDTGCGATVTLLQGVDPSGISYHAPSTGVITSWSYQADAATGKHLKFKVAQPLGGNNYNVVGKSALEMITPGALNTFLTRIPIEAGDAIGYYNPDGAACMSLVGAGPVIHLSNGDKQPGDPWTFPASQSQYKLDVSAQLEPDADGDGFGDETQDGCPTDATTQEVCTSPPDTDPPKGTITKGPKKKTDKPKVKFKFKSDEPNSTFECKLKGPDLKPSVKRFNDCTSPKTYKGLDEGKFTFSLLVTDAAGNPATGVAHRKFKIIGEL